MKVTELLLKVSKRKNLTLVKCYCCFNIFTLAFEKIMKIMLFFKGLIKYLNNEEI